MTDKGREFFKYLVLKIIREASCTYAQAVKQVSQFENTPGFLEAEKKWIAIKPKEKKTYSQYIHVGNRIKKAMDTK